MKSKEPIYKQIIDYYKEQILRGDWEEDKKIPSIRALSSDLRINPNTIKKAYMILEQDGFIYSLQGRGSFVKKIGDESRLIEKKQLISEVEESLLKVIKMGIEESEIIELFKKLYKE